MVRPAAAGRTSEGQRAAHHLAVAALGIGLHLAASACERLPPPAEVAAVIREAPLAEVEPGGDVAPVVEQRRVVEETAAVEGGRVVEGGPVVEEDPPGPPPGFLDGDDYEILREICNAEPTRWERNHGGTTIGYRVFFENGLSALFKPDQGSSHSRWEAEVAAYRLSRYLGIHRVPPSCERGARRRDLERAAGVTPEWRLRLEDEVRFAEDDTVRGVAMYWVPDLRSEEMQLDGEWREWLQPGGRIPPGRQDDAEAMSELLLLDWLTLNIDRWSGGNVRRAGPGGPIVFIDNAAGFCAHRWATPAMVFGRFRIAKRFRRSIVEALRGATDEVLYDILGDILSDSQIEELGRRRDEALAQIDEWIEIYGEDRVFVFE